MRMYMYDQYKSANLATILTLGLHFGCLSVPFGCLSVPFGAFLWLDAPVLGGRTNNKNPLTSPPPPPINHKTHVAGDQQLSPVATKTKMFIM